MSKIQVDTIDTRSGTSTMQIGSTNTTTITLGVSGDTINVPSGVTIANAGTATGFGDNTPAFHAYANNSAIAIANDTYTAMPCANDYFDSDNAFNTSTYKFIPQTAGKYYVYANMVTDGNWNTTAFLMVQKNQGFNADDNRRCSTYATNSAGVHVSGMFTMNGSSDYIEARVYQQSGGSLNLRDQGGENYFGGFLIIGA